jgi:hypothetical protein
MLLIYTQKITPRITYVFKHICTRILGIEIKFTSVIEDLIAHPGPKLSYGKQPLGNELFVQSEDLLVQQGFEAIDVIVKDWEDTKCFFSMSASSALPFDIFSASFFLMSRYEEYLPHVKDAQGRFPATESLAYKEEFLQFPVVDIWAYKFKAILLKHFPELIFTEEKVKIHTLIEARRPFAYTQQGFLRSLLGYGADLWNLKMGSVARRTKVILGLRKDPFNTFKWIINTSKNSKSKLSVFFLLGDGLVFRESLNTQRRKFNMLVKYVGDYLEVGLIFSFASLHNYDSLKKEKKRIEEMTNRTLLSSMNAQFMVNLPEIYRHLVELEVERDFTMVYHNKAGFRAGTCTPFLFYDLDSETKTPLIIHPIAMTTDVFKNKYDAEIYKVFNTIFDTVKELNGTFSMLFTNLDFVASDHNKIWRTIFSEKLQKYED